MRISLENCLSLLTINRRVQLILLLKEQDIDIFCLTKIWLTDEEKI